MNASPLANIKKSQEEYLEKVSRYKSLVDQEGVSVKEIAFMLDEVKCFWLERLEAIEFELEELTTDNSCFLLSGAIYLNAPDYEHYYFKSLGDYHLLSDPFLRMENFFRVPEDRINHKETIVYFKEAYIDTLEVLTKYKNHFFILPIREMAIKDESKHYELLETFSLRFISSMVNKQFSSREEFCNNFKSFEEIENNMDGFVREHLKFSDTDESGLSLRGKIDRYLETPMSFKQLTKDKSESEIFWISIFSWISQISEILYICVYLRLFPYIRFDVTFHYLTIVMYTFIDDKNLKEMIEKTIVFYILHKTIHKKKFENIEFNDFCKLIENKSLLDVIIGKMHVQEIDICKRGIKQVQSIITEEFDAII